MAKISNLNSFESPVYYMGRNIDELNEKELKSALKNIIISYNNLQDNFIQTTNFLTKLMLKKEVKHK
jgi:hypothetical protein